MDPPLPVNEVPSLIWPLVLAVLVIALFKAPRFKGYIGEAKVKLAAKWRLPADIYHPFHSITLPTPDGTTQIDHVFVSRYGIFVIETKNLKGWIFGRESDARWTQTIFGKSFTFQNPLRQNYKHEKALEAALKLPRSSIHSIVVFVGKSTFKTPMPVNVTNGRNYTTYIRSFREPILSEAEVQKAVLRIQSRRVGTSYKTHRQHVQRINSRSNPNAKRKCPRCGNRMVLRTSKRGSNAGTRFWGCSAYPKCRTVQNVT